MSAPAVPADARPSTEVPNAMETPEGHRWYLHPIRLGDDGLPERFVSTTTAMDAMAAPGLPMWYGKKAAELAMDQLPRLTAAAMVKPCAGGPNRCRECIACAIRWVAEQGTRESSRRSDEGKATHAAMRLWVTLGCPPGRYPGMDPEVEPYFRQVVRAFGDLGITAEDVILCEGTILNRRHWYAGTIDLIVRIRASASPAAAELVARVTGWPAGEIIVIVDLKTREREEAAFYPDMGLQLAGYLHGEVILYPDGSEDPMPALHGAVVLQVRPDGYAIRAADIRPDDYDAFVHHLNAFRWQCERGGRIVGAGSRPLPDEMKGTVAAAERVCAAAGRAKKIAKEWGRWRKGDLKDQRPAPAAATAPADATATPIGADAKRTRPAPARSRRRTAAEPRRDPFEAHRTAGSVPGGSLDPDDIPF